MQSNFRWAGLVVQRLPGWLVNGSTKPLRARRQQGGGGVIFWAALISEVVLGPFRVPDGLKMNTQSYTKFLEDNFIP